MSLDKAITHGKEHRAEYHGSKRFDRQCRNHGGCGWCEDNRTYQDRKARAGADQRLEDFEREVEEDESAI